jgi:hypothetical protein
MPSPQLLAQLEQMFAASKSFKAMSEAEQNQIRDKFATASDGEISTAIRVMQQEKVFSDELDAREAKISADKVAAITDLRQAAKRAERVTLQDDEAAETRKTDKQADALLNQIGSEKEPKKKKKLFGIF